MRMLLVVVALGVMSACGNASDDLEACPPGLEPGDVLRVSLLEPYEDGGSFAHDLRLAAPLLPRCGDIDAVGEQRYLRVLVVPEHTTSGDFPACRVHYGTMASDLGLAVGARARSGYSTHGTVLTGGFETTLADGCDGDWWFAVVPSTTGDPLRAPVAGELPPVVFVRGFASGRASTCPSLAESGMPDETDYLQCATAWAASLSLEP
jgi:hypothetical protein